MTRVASVLIPMPLPEAFDYEEPEGMGLAPGELVAVPLGPRQMPGAVLSVRDIPGLNRPLKRVTGRYDEPALPAGVLEFVQWAARYSVDAPGQPLAITLRGARAPRPKPEKVALPTGTLPARATPAREKVLAAAAGESLSPAALAAKAGVSSGVVKGLIDEGCLEVELREPPSAFAPTVTRWPHLMKRAWTTCASNCRRRRRSQKPPRPACTSCRNPCPSWTTTAAPVSRP